MKASELSKLFLTWFSIMYPDALIYRNQAGCVKKSCGSWIKYGIPPKGSADFISFHSIDFNWMGESEKVFIAKFWEVKTKNDIMSDDQKEFADLVTSKGAEYFIIHEAGKSFTIEKWSEK